VTVQAGHEEGPRFSVRTWRAHGAWHASVTVVDPVAAPFRADRLWTTDNDPSGADRPELAVRRAVARFLEIHGERCLCSAPIPSTTHACEEKDGRCVGRCVCGGKRRVLPAEAPDAA
jgi:hypothetical protein